jgi:acetyltransferase-like isoleucine patch superfamily enzyme
MELISSLSYVTEGSLDLFANSIGIHGSLLEVAGSSYYTADGYYYYPIDQYHFKDLARLGLDFFVNYVATSIEKNAAMLRDNTIIPSNLRYYTRTESGGTWSVVEQYWDGTRLVNI